MRPTLERVAKKGFSEEVSSLGKHLKGKRSPPGEKSEVSGSKRMIQAKTQAENRSLEQLRNHKKATVSQV